MLESFLSGLGVVFQPMNLLILTSAVFIGFIGGALPGISGVILVVILLPVTYGMEPTQAFMLLTAIYGSTVFSGLITAILYRAPGTPEAVMTAFDGYPMTQQGEAGKALGIGVLSSAVGGLVGTIALIIFTPMLASVALKFSSPEYFALAILGLTVVASLGGRLILGLIGATLGLLIATIGIDPLTGTSRYTFDNLNLAEGVGLIPVIVGLFAVSEVMKRSLSRDAEQPLTKVKIKIFDAPILKKIGVTLSRSSILGVIIGILPGIGASTAAMVSYSETVRWSKHPEKFGKGAPEGIAAPEAANNAAAMGALVPLFALGIPGSGTTAIILGAFIMHGLQPGPMFMLTSSDLIYAVFAGLFVVNFMILAFSKPFIKLFTRLLNVPYSALGPIILMCCIVGTYSVRNSMFDVWLMLGFGVLGFLLEKIKFPLVSIILGLVLGPIAESELRRSLAMSQGDLGIFFSRPISASLIAIAVLLLGTTIVIALRKRARNRAAAMG
ncbi:MULTISPECIES: tripartite tricarboxylate transporter permease [unclassified Halomonas]|uniref:tripartite tricarboxylate transporter permease n=1 Tax=unclassified Halomonas TaxID=2609666 RepID=UPI0005FA13BD|nr:MULTISPECIES: tripartite tricarboxylate transporter permease [unclassified Halomonas]MBR9880973.1 C4-dicarboxylate ABC transporter permease [Gammaproteobacteria bacterium]KJZ06393.1 C4-dicarboxylate ABC transporter permease [Halomonas sp. S2151]MBY5941239.1 tripartite tricarboxylate transporter permease [Halomonas sp. DP5N14-9]MBY6111580.1 tripartite tricarboxylate transporter permease [Halomonas sp. DP1Y21-3]MCJ8286928.1 tripartite tricarboxylate transporter permease [Halomonas sp.]|tara:strand:- start:1205 stop:2698 length:1494 start_codon:yes stop_codon:yes gene_type:complete